MTTPKVTLTLHCPWIQFRTSVLYFRSLPRKFSRASSHNRGRFGLSGSLERPPAPHRATEAKLPGGHHRFAAARRGTEGRTEVRMKMQTSSHTHPSSRVAAPTAGRTFRGHSLGGYLFRFSFFSSTFASLGSPLSSSSPSSFSASCLFKNLGTLVRRFSFAAKSALPSLGPAASRTMCISDMKRLRCSPSVDGRGVGICFVCLSVHMSVRMPKVQPLPISVKLSPPAKLHRSH